MYCSTLRALASLRAFDVSELAVRAADVSAFDVSAFDVNALDVSAFDVNALEVRALEVVRARSPGETKLTSPSSMPSAATQPTIEELSSASRAIELSDMLGHVCSSCTNDR